MKKIVFLIIALLTVCLFVSCGTDGGNTPGEEGKENSSETGAETTADSTVEQPKRLSEDEKAKYYKVVEFELPEGSFRDAIVDYMRKCSSLKWVASENFGMNNVFGDNDWSVSLSYKMGQTYYGLPYTGYFVNYEYFEDLLVNGKYAPTATGWQEAPGLNCYSAILLAAHQFEPVSVLSPDWVPGQKDFDLKTVGTYKAPQFPQSTHEINEYNGKDVMYESYMQLKKGDILYRKDFGKQDYLHCRVVVEDAVIVRNGVGKIIPSRCTVKTIEQTNKFDSSRNDGINTTWYVDHVYSFDALFNTDYVPLTLKSYSKQLSEMEVPYILLHEEIDVDLLTKGAFGSNCTVKSNFPLLFVKVDILDKDGKIVQSQEKGDLKNIYATPLRNYFSSLFDGVQKGEYTIVLTAGIASGTVELARADFTYGG